MVRKALLLSLLLLSLRGYGQDEMLAWGKILDATTHKGISANIRYSSIPTGSIYGRFVDSTFSFPIFGVVRYQITAEAQGYNPRTVILDPREIGLAEKVIRNIVLTPVGETVRLDHLIFEQGKAHIDPGSYQELDEVVEMMRDNTRIVIQLEGHTDNVGSSKANLKLSQKRVDAVKRYLVSNGVSGKRIKTKAFGGSQPVSNDDTPEGRNLNRRVEMRILRQ